MTGIGIKETKELLVGVNELSIELTRLFHDGVDLKDFIEFYEKLKTDHDFQEKLQAAYDNFQMVPMEVKDVDMAEGIELITTQIEFIPKFVAALKTPVVATPAVVAPVAPEAPVAK